jgi:hypothetical protein
VGTAIVNALLDALELRASSFSLGVRRPSAVSTARFVLIEPANVAKLVALEAPAKSKVR